jgi:hypothetical protein
MLSRRDLTLGTPALVASVVLWDSDCYAKGLGGVFKKVAASVVQGINFVTNPAAEIAAAAKVITPLIKQISPDAARATEMIQKIADQSSTIEGRLRIIAGVLAPQALPILANVGFGAEQITQFAQQSGSPLNLSSSLEDELRHSPGSYVEKNYDELKDHVSRTATVELAASTYDIQAGEIVANGIPSKGAPGGPGFYPSVLTIADVLQLVSIFRGD